MPTIYFLIVLIIGNYVLLKLFLAILIFNFSSATKTVSENNDNSENEEENEISQKPLSE